MRNISLGWVRVHTGRALIAVSRHLSRAGSHLLGHPSARPKRVERPALAIVHTPQRASTATEAAMLRRYTGFRDAR